MRRQRGRVDAPVLLAITVLVTLFTVLPMLVSVTAGLTNNFSARFGQRLHHALARRGVVALRRHGLALAGAGAGLRGGGPADRRALCLDAGTQPSRMAARSSRNC
jgi:hypothetical protein